MCLIVYLVCVVILLDYEYSIYEYFIYRQKSTSHRQPGGCAAYICDLKIELD